MTRSFSTRYTSSATTTSDIGRAAYDLSGQALLRRGAIMLTAVGTADACAKLDSVPGRSMTPGTETAEDYTGHELDAEANSFAGQTGMHYAGARYYMSALGRWNGPDPILGEQSPAKLLKDGKVQAFSMSAYTYSFNNPANLRDETGKWPTPDTFLDIGFIAYDVYDIASTALRGEEVSGTQWAALAADGGSLLIPAATGGGMAVRAAAKGDEVVQGSKAYWKAIRQAGRKGEEITQSVYGFSKKEAEVLVPSPSGTTKSGTRRVDFMNAEHGMVESKNVAELSFTQQLRDFADVAEELNVDFTIVTRKDTKITGPLQDAIDEGRIKLNRQIE